MRRMRILTILAFLLTGIVGAAIPRAEQAPAQQPAGSKAPVHAKQVRRVLIQHAMVINGNGMPAMGPFDILTEDGVISRIGASSAGWPDADMVIDGTGKWVMPGIINTHMHWHVERVGALPIQYSRNLYLAAGVTTARE